MVVTEHKKSFFLTLTDAGCYTLLVELKYFGNLLESNKNQTTIT